MRITATFLSVLSVLASAVSARSSTGDRVLVVRDKKYDNGYNKFFESLKDRGYELTFAEPKSPKTMIEAHGVPLYNHLIVFAPESDLHASLSPKNLLAAQATYLNTLYVLSPELDAAQAALVREYDIEPTQGVLYDAFSHVGGGSESDVVLSPASLIAPGPILGSKKDTNSVVYGKGTGFTTGQNPFLVDIAAAPETAYLGDNKAKPLSTPKPGHQVRLAGHKVSLVAAMQTRENVRIGFVGSVELFNDEWWAKKLDGSETGNRAFLSDLSKWLFQETGVLRVDSTHHNREGETEPLEEYTKKDNVNYEITLSEHVTATDGTSSWVPARLDDLQLEFTMLDPHYRIPLTATDVDGKYAAQFVAPDRHGVFKFVVNYFRPGYTFVQSADKTSVVPLRHDQHPRFIVGAYPFYTGALSTSAAFIFFVLLWIRLGEADRKATKAQKSE